MYTSVKRGNKLARWLGNTKKYWFIKVVIGRE